MATQAQAQAPQSALFTPRAVIPPPAGMLSSCFTRDPRFGRGPGVYPIKVMGTFTQTAGTPYVAPLNLCYIPPNSILTNFTIAAGTMAGNLVDTLPTATVYAAMNAAGTPPITTMAQMNGAALGTMYGNTPRVAGPQGPAVVQWQQGITLAILGAGPGNGNTVYFMLEFSPTYDAGV